MSVSGVPPRRGRPPGKRSHHDFDPIAYIRKDTHARLINLGVWESNGHPGKRRPSIGTSIVETDRIFLVANLRNWIGYGQLLDTERRAVILVLIQRVLILGQATEDTRGGIDDSHRPPSKPEAVNRSKRFEFWSHSKWLLAEHAQLVAILLVFRLLVLDVLADDLLIAPYR